MYPESTVKQDLRREERVPAEGIVWIEFGPHSLAARLQDVSASGFRAAHDCPYLTTGEVVTFRHPYSTGSARVVWSRITGSSLESGFLIVT